MKKTTDIVFLLDRSGSMRGLENDTIGGYNSYVDNMRKQDINVTTVLFDDKYEMIEERKNIKEIKELTNKTYFTRGGTALLDAIGKTINYMDDRIAKKVLFVITTDGYENASREFTKEQIKELIKGHSNWEFIYIGADIDSYSEASKIGISEARTANYQKNSKSVGSLFKTLECMTSSYCEYGQVKDDWKESLDNYLEENKQK